MFTNHLPVKNCWTAAVVNDLLEIQLVVKMLLKIYSDAVLLSSEDYIENLYF
jgi:hypothetical protein